ncbi:MAG: hypothetical protein ACREAC_05555 [Blastocatellia bacterium]
MLYQLSYPGTNRLPRESQILTQEAPPGSAAFEFDSITLDQFFASNPSTSIAAGSDETLVDGGGFEPP